MVEWKSIGEISSNVFAGGTPSTKHEEYYDGDIPWIRSGEIDFNVITKAERNITTAGYKNSSAKLIRKGSVVMAMTGATVAKSAIVDFETTANQSVCAIETVESIVNYKFVFYSLAKDYFKIRSSAQGALTSLNLAMIKQLQIPIPSLSEQQRIVSILDTFTSSISNLKQQIEERRKQYEYERNLLLDLEGKEGVEMKKLGECVLFITDGDHQPPPKSSEGIPFVTISDIEKLSHTIDFSNTFFVPQEYYNSLKSDKKAKKGDVLYTVTGSFGIPVLIEDNREFCFQRHIALIRPNNTIALSRYIYHWLCSNYAKKQGEEKASGGAQKTVSLNSLRSFRFYYPPLQAQSRIVSILDTFEQSISNLEEQLAMREKQYEYYRNQLLTFEGEEERGKT